VKLCTAWIFTANFRRQRPSGDHGEVADQKPEKKNRKKRLSSDCFSALSSGLTPPPPPVIRPPNAAADHQIVGAQLCLKRRELRLFGR